MDDLADLFSSLGHPLRLRIVRLLMRRPMCVCRLATALEAPQSTVSRNLALLKRTGLVDRQQCGTFVRYALADSFAGVSLEPLYQLVARLTPDIYDEEAVDAALEARGTTVPPLAPPRRRHARSAMGSGRR